MFDSSWPHGLSPSGSSVLGILQARILEWVAISSSRGSSPPRDWTHISCIGRWFLSYWATWETPGCCRCQSLDSQLFWCVDWLGRTCAQICVWDFREQGCSWWPQETGKQNKFGGRDAFPLDMLNLGKFSNISSKTLLCLVLGASFEMRVGKDKSPNILLTELYFILWPRTGR